MTNINLLINSFWDRHNNNKHTRRERELEERIAALEKDKKQVPLQGEKIDFERYKHKEPKRGIRYVKPVKYKEVINEEKARGYIEYKGYNIKQYEIYKGGRLEYQYNEGVLYRRVKSGIMQYERGCDPGNWLMIAAISINFND